MKSKNNIQQGTDEWYHIRKGKITGTTLKAIMGTPKARQEAIYEIIAERLIVGVENGDYENPMERGSRLEPEAIAQFEFQTGLKVDTTGFCESDVNHLIAQSPDGLIGETEAIEVKCPGGKNYVKAWITNQIPEEYAWQVAQYFIVNEKLEKLYFVLYHPDISVHPMHIMEITRAELEKEINVALNAQHKFLEEVDEILKGIIEL